jgi:hypothetical protein
MTNLLSWTEMSRATINILQKCHIDTVGQLLDYYDGDLKSLGLNNHSVRECRELIDSYIKEHTNRYCLTSIH